MTGTQNQTTTQTIVKTFQPLPWQVAPFRNKSFIQLLTGSAGGGKSRLAMEKINGYCLKYPGTFALMIRKVKVSMTSGSVLFYENEVVTPDVLHLSSKSRFEYPNGSIMAYLGLEDEKQLKRLRSIGRRGGVDIAMMEEGTEFTETDFNAVIARMRGTTAPWRQVVIPTNPDAPTHWINSRLILGGEAKVYYSAAKDNPHNPDDYLAILDSLTGVDKLRLAKGQWVQASGIVYDVWSDEENVTEDADYIEGGGLVYWSVDDGYSAGSRFPTGIDPVTKTYSADAHPRTIGFYQLRPTGQLCRFDELYRVKALEENQIEEALELGYPSPQFASVDSSAAQLRNRLQMANIPALKATHRVEEGIKELRRWLAPDENGFRRLIIHPRCKHFRSEMVSYRYDDRGNPIKEFDHGPDEARYLTWKLRYNT